MAMATEEGKAVTDAASSGNVVGRQPVSVGPTDGWLAIPSRPALLLMAQTGVVAAVLLALLDVGPTSTKNWDPPPIQPARQRQPGVLPRALLQAPGPTK